MSKKKNTHKKTARKRNAVKQQNQFTWIINLITALLNLILVVAQIWLLYHN